MTNDRWGMKVRCLVAGLHLDSKIEEDEDEEGEEGDKDEGRTRRWRGRTRTRTKRRRRRRRRTRRRRRRRRRVEGGGQSRIEKEGPLAPWRSYIWSGCGLEKTKLATELCDFGH